MVILAAAILGLAVGAVASSAFDTPQSECDRTEESIRQQANISGAIACFEPGVIDINRSERVEEGSELQCVCRQSINGSVRIFAINRAR